jgi:hypothetical protein
MKPLWQRLGLSEPSIDRRVLQKRLAATAQQVFDELTRAKSCRSGAVSPELELPAMYQDVLCMAASATRSVEEEQRLLDHYLKWMPALRVRQLLSREGTGPLFFHEPLEWSRLTRLSGALDRLFAFIRSHGLDPEHCFGHATSAAYRENHPCLASAYAQTCFGGAMPMLYGFPHDTDSYTMELEKADFQTVFDRRLGAPLVHELSHLQRHRTAIYPPILDESLSGYLGICVLPSMAFPEAGENNALMGAPWFGQIGQCLVRVFGWTALLQAHGGLGSWEEATSPAFVRAAERLGWAQFLLHRSPHFLEGNTEPQIWQKLCFLHLAGEPLASIVLKDLSARSWESIDTGPVKEMDRHIIDDALKAMCLHNTRVSHSYRVSSMVPVSEIDIDMMACRVSRSSAVDSDDPAPPAYLFPPPVAALWRQRGTTRLRLRLSSLDGLEEASESLFTCRLGTKTGSFELKSG